MKNSVCAKTFRRGSSRPARGLLTRIGSLVLAAGLLLAASPHQARAFPAPCYTDAGAGLPGIEDGDLSWGDYDNDGDLDILLTGWTGSPTARVYRSSGGPNPAFSDINAGLAGVNYSSGQWGDYDNDGDLDILITGRAGALRLALVYRNEGGADPTFTDIGAGLPGVETGTGIWGDYDNDGDLDILITGYDGTNPITKIFRNDRDAIPRFVESFYLTGVYYSQAAWGDYDKDGNLDVVVLGRDSAMHPTTRLYRNNGGTYPTFSGLNAGFTGVILGSVAWGDYDNDGDLDLLLTGDGEVAGSVSKIYRNNGGTFPTFTDIGAAIAPVKYGIGAWGDCDNDGYLDILLSGWDNVTPLVTRIYRSSGGASPFFTDMSAGLPGLQLSTAAWADYDNDGDLDFLLGGSSPYTTRLYRAGCAALNYLPQAPTNLSAAYNGTRFTFSWSPALDPQTPSPGLTYNLRIGTSPGADDILSAMAAPGGFRRVAAMGNTGHKVSWDVLLPGAPPYYWSVQTIDASFAGSPFSPEQAIVQSGVEDSPRPATAAVWSAGPNPFSTLATIGFSQPTRGQVSLDIFDVTGRKVRRLVEEELEAGSFTRSWDGRDDRGQTLPSGLYFVRLAASDILRHYRITMMR